MTTSDATDFAPAPGSADIGVYGLGVMGANLARNLARHGHSVAVFNRTPARTRRLMERHADEGDFAPATRPADFVASLRRPRAVIVMVQAGAAPQGGLDPPGAPPRPGDIIGAPRNPFQPAPHPRAHPRVQQRRQGVGNRPGLRCNPLRQIAGAEDQHRITNRRRILAQPKQRHIHRHPADQRITLAVEQQLHRAALNRARKTVAIAEGNRRQIARRLRLKTVTVASEIARLQPPDRENRRVQRHHRTQAQPRRITITKRRHPVERQPGAHHIRPRLRQNKQRRRIGETTLPTGGQNERIEPRQLRARIIQNIRIGAGKLRGDAVPAHLQENEHLRQPACGIINRKTESAHPRIQLDPPPKPGDPTHPVRLIPRMHHRHVDITDADHYLVRVKTPFQ